MTTQKSDALTWETVFTGQKTQPTVSKIEGNVTKDKSNNKNNNTYAQRPIDTK